MREISLHILDIVQNSIAAGATRIIVRVEVDSAHDVLTLTVEDNGRGMSPEMVATVIDPFVTTRTTRKVGLGIPMLAAAAEMTGGQLSIESALGVGTTIKATFGLSHIDRAPFGDIVSTMVTVIVANPEVSFRYEQSVDGREFVLDMEQVKEALDGVPVNDPLVIQWIRDYMKDGISHVGSIA